MISGCLIGLVMSVIPCEEAEIEDASWFHVEGPEVSVEPFRDHGDGVYVCSATEEELTYGPTFSESRELFV
jgi:hypothetical protein